MKPIALVVGLGLATVVGARSSAAQPPHQVPRIAMLRVDAPSDPRSQGLTEAFRQGLRDLGYVEGQSIRIEYRYAEGQLDRLPGLAWELVGLKPDVLVTQGTPATLAARRATQTIPIVVGGAGDLVGAGLVASLARPGGNVTGSTNLDPELSAKRLALLREVLPKVVRVAILYYGGPGGDPEELRETDTAARGSGVRVQPVQVTDPNQFQAAYAAMSAERAEALIIFQGSFTLSHRKPLLELATAHRLPTMGGEASWAEDGGLISYGYDRLHQWRRAATFVDKILKGAKPADLPVEQPVKFELVINLRTAKTLGVTIPSQLLTEADRVIK
jgi:putative ABC transport system substrate-binding protein